MDATDQAIAPSVLMYRTAVVSSEARLPFGADTDPLGLAFTSRIRMCPTVICAITAIFHQGRITLPILAFHVILVAATPITVTWTSFPEAVKVAVSAALSSSV